MKFPPWLKVYGDTAYRGKCASEKVEQIAFFSAIRRRPDGLLFLHPRNEGKRTPQQAALQTAEGMVKGTADIITPFGFVCEMKRRDHTQSKWEIDQLTWLSMAYESSCFVCVALGAAAALEAVKDFDLQRE